MRILQAWILKWGGISFFRGSSRLRDQIWVSCIAGGFLTFWATTIVTMFYFRYSDLIQLMAETLFSLLPISLHSHTPPPNLLPPVHGNQFSTLFVVVKSLQSCPTLCNPIDGSSPGSPVPGILQARTLEWVAISLSNAWKWKVKVKSLSRVRLFSTPWSAAYQAPP